MEPLKSHLEKQMSKLEKVQEPTSYLTRYEQIADSDQKMLQLKYGSPCLLVLQPDVFINVTRVLLLKIYVITGWSLPKEEMLTILLDQFQKKLQESYFNLNADEIEYAFRQHTLPEDWGKEMNLNLLDKVLIPYLNQRLYLSAEEERKKSKPTETIYTQEQLDNFQRKDIEEFYQLLRSGVIPRFIPDFKEVLQKDGLIKDETVEQFFMFRLQKGFVNVYTKVDG